MTARAATDNRPVSLTKRQWHLICLEWEEATDKPNGQTFAHVLNRAVPLIEAACDLAESPDDLVSIPASLSGWGVVAAFCGTTEMLRWNVVDDIEKQIKVYSHGG